MGTPLPGEERRAPTDWDLEQEGASFMDAMQNLGKG
jgi:hypothetical protein